MEYDQTPIPQIYAVARALPREAMDVWSRTLREMVPADATTARVLDLGCGTGRFASLLARTFHAGVIGVDASVRMILQRDEREAGASFVVGTAEAIPLAASAVDLVFVSMVYHHLGSAASAVTEIARVLRPGGYAIVRNPTRESADAFEYLRFFPEALALDVARMPPRRAIDDAFASAGFRGVAHRVVRHRFAEDYADYHRKIALRGLSSLQMISDAAFERGLRDFARYCRSARASGPIYEPVETFVFQR